ncbi:thymopoietin L homeolog isoform 2 [Xenopus laevis]|uniref:Lamina associated protein 2-beta isoform n=1 Tax=Xenopus laevis TaxID=8355 RepID=Q4LDN2_XENLA|nr:thymopoietin L homeolog isoform 2 [Xenopus laevis]AAC05383.1 lamina associated protein 2-beta isoform [Xenopus laevis]
MPEFLQDPSVLTKEKLKSELVANNVTLPSGEQRKDVYVQLYLQHLTSQNRATPDFSSDEEREATPMRGRGRPPGRKATKKTDKPRAEEKDDPDVTELSNEALKEELLKYGMKPGPILSNTRKLYEQRLLKLREQGLESSAPPADSSKADNKQNGNTDSEHYSDKEEEAKIELTFEKREPLRGKSKTQVMRNRRTEKTETVSEDVVTEAAWTSGPAKSGPVQTVYKELAKVTRRTPRKKVVAPDPVPFDDADIAEVPPISESVVEPASNQILTYAENEHFESRKVVNQVPESLKHAETLLSVSEFSELTRRTSKKPLISEKHLNLTRETDSGSSQIRLIDVHSIGFTNPTDLLNTALIEETKHIIEDSLETPKKTKQLKITKFVTPVKKQIVEKTFEERRTERDILKEMFPTEFSTPTGISASCRRPIRGAAGRPLNATDLKINETYTSKYVSNVSKYTPAVEVKSEKVKPGRSLPVWIKILMFLILVVFCLLVYQAMETNEGMSFSKLLLGITESNKTEN